MMIRVAVLCQRLDSIRFYISAASDGILYGSQPLESYPDRAWFRWRRDRIQSDSIRFQSRPVRVMSDSQSQSQGHGPIRFESCAVTVGHGAVTHCLGHAKWCPNIAFLQQKITEGSCILPSIQATKHTFKKSSFRD